MNERFRPMNIRIKNTSILEHALFETDQCFSDEEVAYGKGILVGVVSGISATTGADFKSCLKAIVDHMPFVIDWKCVPESWHTELKSIKGDY